VTHRGRPVQVFHRGCRTNIRQLAQATGLTVGMILFIVKRKNWGHIL
jgi:hypothetical protein